MPIRILKKSSAAQGGLLTGTSAADAQNMSIVSIPSVAHPSPRLYASALNEGNAGSAILHPKQGVHRAEKPPTSKDMLSESDQAEIDTRKKKQQHKEALDSLYNAISQIAPIWTRPMHLISSNWRISDTVPSKLSQYPLNYLVVGVLGKMGCGRTFVLNELAGQLSHQSVPQSSQNATQHASAEPQPIFVGVTGNIDIFITAERLILLDSQPLLCDARAMASVRGGTAGKQSQEEWKQHQSKSLASLLYSTCDIVLVVSSTAPTAAIQQREDLEVWQMLEQVRQSIIGNQKLGLQRPGSEEKIPHFARTVFVRNKCDMGVAAEPCYTKQDSYDYLSRILTSLNVNISNWLESPKQVFQIPVRSHAKARRKEWTDSTSLFRANIFSHPRTLSRIMVTEIDWLRHLARTARTLLTSDKDE